MSPECKLSSAMVLKAVFFDLDDTLVPTCHIDRRAHAKATKFAAMQSASVLDENKLLADYKQLFNDAPWDPEHKIEVTRWRANLWCRALQAQNIPNSESLSAEMQVRKANRPSEFPVPNRILQSSTS